MTFAPATTMTRRAAPSHQPWIPLPYMLKAVEHLEHRMVAGLALDPGLGKTSITLETFCRLMSKGMARTMLVIAPLKVCRNVWRQEGAKWSQFRHLRFSLLHGAKKADRLKDQADIWLVNPEGVQWLSQQFFGRSLPFDIVTIDELTKFKNHSAERSKALRKRTASVPRKWGLTGSLMPNGYMDLFGQQLQLDGGAALGRFITHYRDQYFQVDYNGFDYVLQPGADRRIIQRIAPYWLQMSADDYLDLPPLVDDIHELELEKPARAIYDKMKRDMVATLPEGVVTGANTAAVYSKLSQMANGAVYVGDSRQVAHIHDEKLDALEELVEELAGAPLLVAYEFNHDVDRLKARFGADLPTLGKGVSAAQEADYIARWNRNELPILACHPASAGHGLNLQEGSAAHVCWFGVTWDLELYDQFIKRVRRQGNTTQRIFNHLLLVRGTIDELKLDALRDKSMTQSGLLRALNIEILRDAETPVGGDQSARETRLSTMVAKLSRQQNGGGGVATAERPPQDTAAPRVSPKGWGNPAGNGATVHPVADNTQRERIAQQLQPATDEGPSPRDRAQSAFSPQVQQHMEEVRTGTAGAQPAPDYPPPAAAAKRTRRPAPVADAAPEAPSVRPELKIELLKLAFADSETTLEDGLEIAKSMLEWVQE